MIHLQRPRKREDHCSVNQGFKKGWPGLGKALPTLLFSHSPPGPGFRLYPQSSLWTPLLPEAGGLNTSCALTFKRELLIIHVPGPHNLEILGAGVKHVNFPKNHRFPGILMGQ